MSPPRPMQWRSLEHLADTPAFRRFVEAEWPALQHVPSGPQRRQVLKLMAASFALAGLSGCDAYPDPRDEEVPYVRDPERQAPASWMHYASAALLDGLANGVLVRTRDGRPIKIEGNPQHPWSRGGTDVFAQASILDLYDPARSQAVRHLGEASLWQAFQGAVTGPLAQLRASGGAGLRLLTGPVSSPSLQAQIAALQAALPAMHWHSHAPIGRDAAYEGTRLAFGRPLETRYRFDRARLVVALEGDLLDPGPHQVGFAHDWIAARQASAKGPLLALYSAASMPTLTSAKADDPLVASPAEIEALATGLLADLTDPAPAGDTALSVWRARVGAALRANRGTSLVVAGSTAPPRLQEAVHRLNAALGNVGQTVFYTQPALAQAEPLADLAAAMASGSVQIVLLLEANPAYDAPAGLHFAEALQRVPLKIHAGLFEDETAIRCDWHVPLAHPLESWGDARALDGTITLMQPTIAPLFEGRSLQEILSLLADPSPRAGRDLLRAHYQGAQGEQEFAPRWDAMLRDGFVPDSAFPEESPALAAVPAAPAPAAAEGLTVLFRPDPTVWDGSRANNPWLQELPKPLTKLVWENAVFLGPALAGREGIATGDEIVLELNGASLQAPAWVLPGMADGCVGLTLGYGRSASELVSAGLGYDSYALRATAALQTSGATLRKTKRATRFATTQDHNSMEGQDFVRVQYEGDPPVGETTSWRLPSLYRDRPRAQTGAAWGMVIDLDACIGCNACVVACQAENNIPVVGRDQVALGREMHWLRVDRYYEGPAEAPQTHFMPVPCMHCEQAPCEAPCPVEATLHDSEGLNLMVYNRCVGTRACSGYCPYKVRHFNYLDYSAGAAPTRALQHNPEVTVRARGVMEKCTYCVQRIEAARIEADTTNAPIADGAVQTACQGACPTRAITFGDLNDKTSAVAAARADGRNYALLGELNTRPRTSYLAERAPRRMPEDRG